MNRSLLGSLLSWRSQMPTVADPSASDTKTQESVPGTVAKTVLEETGPKLKKWSCGNGKLVSQVDSKSGIIKQAPSALSLTSSLAAHGRGLGQEGKVRGPYVHHEPLNRVNMAKAAALLGPTRVGQLAPTLYGYAKTIAKQTVGTWVRKLFTDQEEPAKIRKRKERSVPDDVRSRVLTKVEEDEAHQGETTTDYVADLFRAEGWEVSEDFVRTFLHDQHKSLRTPTAHTDKELDDDSIEHGVRGFWSLLESLRLGGLGRDIYFVSLDEKPLWVDRFKRMIWREIGRGANVKALGRTRQRETVILPIILKFSSSGVFRQVSHLPLVFIFHGKRQLKVEVPAGYPCLVMFVPSGSIVNTALVHVFERAIIPNLDREGTIHIFLDEDPAHFHPRVAQFFQKQANLHRQTVPRRLTA